MYSRVTDFPFPFPCQLSTWYDEIAGRRLNLELSLSCRFLRIKTAVMLVVRNHGDNNVTP